MYTLNEGGPMAIDNLWKKHGLAIALVRGRTMGGSEQGDNGSLADGVGFSHVGAAAVISLDRSPALNAITVSMRRRIAGLLPDIARDVMIYILVLESACGRAFSAGGDLRELTRLANDDPVGARQSFREEYSLNWMLECFSKPSISLINGMVIGGGNGLTMFSTHRVAGERYRFSMPETAIGFFPDDGLAHVFARLPDSIGVYLGLTGRSISRADAFFLGLVTHCIEDVHYDRIKELMAEAEPVDPVLDALHVAPGASEIERLAPVIRRCFGARTVEDIVARLEREREHREWCDGVLADLARRSPLALKITLRHIRNAAALDIRQTLQLDFRLACRLLERPDFAEGVRALLIDRDQQPNWHPADLAGVTDAMVEDCFRAMPAGELHLPTRAEMQAQRL
ncbi:MAG: hypothetical protein RLZ98_2223 [Pseudomonadota bacterium]|jgi:enoyl-CoA hydratase